MAPYWRIIKDDGSLLEKIHGGPEHQAELLRTEDFKLLQVGKHKFEIKDYKNYLI